MRQAPAAVPQAPASAPQAPASAPQVPAGTVTAAVGGLLSLVGADTDLGAQLELLATTVAVGWLVVHAASAAVPSRTRRRPDPLARRR